MIFNGTSTKDFYYVNKKASVDGKHTIHTGSCWVLPNEPVYVGRYASVEEAEAGTQQRYPQLSRCPYCLKN